LRKLGTRLQGHPDSNLLPGIEVSTGSLGQGLSVACGEACGLRLNGIDSNVFVLMGDGECEEGQVWEAAMFAAHQKLGKIIAIIDRNGLQIDGYIEDVCNPEDLRAKFEAFGWKVKRVDGHDLDALIEALNEFKETSDDKPAVIIADTVKGKGVSFMENEVGWHGKAPNKEQYIMAMEELGANAEKLTGFAADDKMNA
ncbi:MAG: transketolase, partial [Eggerthellaceae bacterium]|nr:transketolase [Eggerthellaceae bacterium]